MPLDFRHPHAFWASIITETLTRLGLKIAIICPGSRSSLLAIAFAQHPDIEAIPILDERSAAFFALGVAKRSYNPVVLVCTSGTAGANFYPAVIEASESRVPLIVLTADRPQELRHCHAGQTIEQTRLFSHYPRWQTELALPSTEPIHWRYLRQTILQAWLRSQFPLPGVVHLNCPFRDPLVPVLDLDFHGSMDDFEEIAFFNGIHQAMTLPHAILPNTSKLIRQWQQEPRGIIIAGVINPRRSKQYCQAIAILAQWLNYPILAEALSPVRNFADCHPYLISTYDLLLRDRRQADSLVPDIVIQTGEFPTSKELRTWLGELEPPCWIIDDHADNLDPLHLHSYHLPINLVDFVAPLMELTLPHKPSSTPYLEQWLFLEKRVQNRIDQTLAGIDWFLEAKIPRILARHLPKQTQLFVANSLSVRYLEWFWPPCHHKITPYFNRGANGIDGTLSTSLGVAHGTSKTILLTGDLALLHDSNGFLINPHFKGHLTIILVNNQGGGIFEMLPIVHFDSFFEDFFATPQQVDFRLLAASYGIEHLKIQDWTQLIALIEDLPAAGIRLLELNCDRKRNAQWLKENLGKFAQNHPEKG